MRVRLVATGCLDPRAEVLVVERQDCSRLQAQARSVDDMVDVKPTIHSAGNGGVGTQTRGHDLEHDPGISLWPRLRGADQFGQTGNALSGTLPSIHGVHQSPHRDYRWFPAQFHPQFVGVDYSHLLNRTLSPPAWRLLFRRAEPDNLVTKPQPEPVDRPQPRR